MSLFRSGTRIAAACPAEFKVFMRSLTLQASWNPQRMQNLGLVFTLIPWLRCQNANVGEVRRFCRRHYAFFNTNPYLSNYLLGGLLRLEKDQADKGRPDRVTIRDFKDSLGRALASMGDQIFWLGLQPSLMLLAVALVMAGWWPAALASVILFGILEIFLRFYSLRQGHRLGLDIVELLGRPGWHRAIRWAGRSGSLIAGAVVALAVFPRSGGQPIDAGAWIVYPLIVFVSMMLRRRMPGESILLLLLPLALLLAYL